MARRVPGWIGLGVGLIWIFGIPVGGINCLSFSVGPVSVGAVWMLQFGCWGRERGGGRLKTDGGKGR